MHIFYLNSFLFVFLFILSHHLFKYFVSYSLTTNFIKYIIRFVTVINRVTCTIICSYATFCLFSLIILNELHVLFQWLCWRSGTIWDVSQQSCETQTCAL